MCSIQTIETPPRANVADQLDQRRAFVLGQAAGDLVEQQHARRGGERARELEPLAVEQREAAGRPVRLVGEAALLEQLDAARIDVALALAAAEGRPPPPGSRTRSCRLNGCGIWNERPMPMRQRRSGASRVMSVPANSTRRPASGATVPAMMPNSVVLPAPFGPMMPSASPSASARSIAVRHDHGAEPLGDLLEGEDGGMHVTRQPVRHPGRERRGAPTWVSSPCQRGSIFQRPRLEHSMGPRFRGATSEPLQLHRLISRQQLQLAADRNLRRGLVGGDDQVELVALRCHWPATSGVLVTFFTGWPVHFTGPTIDL